MMQLFAYIRPVTRNLVKSHGRRSFTTWLPQHSSLLFSAYNKPEAPNKRIIKLHTSPSTISTHGEPETFKRDYPTLLKGLRNTESSWMKHMLELEKIISNSDYMKSLATEKKFKGDNFKQEEIFTDGMRDENEEMVRSLACDLLDLDIPEDISLIKLRTELFLPFRVAVRQIVEPKLTAKPKKIQEEKEGDYLIWNCYNADRDTDYSLFLKQFKLDLESGNLNCFLSGLGINNAREFYEICEFALKGDQEVFRHVHQFWIYYMEEEVSECDGQFEFDREGILEMIGKMKYSESLPKNCVKMVHYLSKLV